MFIVSNILSYSNRDIEYRSTREICCSINIVNRKFNEYYDCRTNEYWHLSSNDPIDFVCSSLNSIYSWITTFMFANEPSDRNDTDVDSSVIIDETYRSLRLYRMSYVSRSQWSCRFRTRFSLYFVRYWRIFSIDCFFLMFERPMIVRD
jgi:hypothetical protein